MTKYLLVTCFALAAWCHPVWCSAQVQFILEPVGSVFSDPSPRAPVGGNAGTTLGEQRRTAVQFAADLWGRRLDSPVPILVSVALRDVGCGAHSAMLAGASAVSLLSGVEATARDAELWYPSALANRLAGRDLEPGEPDIRIVINAAIDGVCRSQLGGFYYGLDARPGNHVDLVEVLLHEIAHGLGFASFVALDTGALLEAGVDTFSAHLLDLSSGRSWRELGPAERQASAQNVRAVVFSGAKTREAARGILSKGVPALQLSPTPPGYRGAVAGGAGPFPSIAGRLQVTPPGTDCPELSSSVRDGVVMLWRAAHPTCTDLFLSQRLRAAGALATLFVLDTEYQQPALDPRMAPNLGLPALFVSAGDASSIELAARHQALQATMVWDSTRLAGADAEGRPFVFASQPVSQGSSISHFEPLARPDLLMEPFIATTPRHELDLTLAAMIDLGWEPICGNGKANGLEECDDGAANSDDRPDACRSDCRRARCGDGVRDRGEECDEGLRNADHAAHVCRTACALPRCGDGVRDSGEECDDGAANDDSTPDACRTTCLLPHCGDAVVDRGEQCDGPHHCANCAQEDGRDWDDPWDVASSTRGDREATCAVATTHDGLARLQTTAFLALSVLLGWSRCRRSKEAGSGDAGTSDAG